VAGKANKTQLLALAQHADLEALAKSVGFNVARRKRIKAAAAQSRRDMSAAAFADLLVLANETKDHVLSLSKADRTELMKELFNSTGSARAAT